MYVDGGGGDDDDDDDDGKKKTGRSAYGFSRPSEKASVMCGRCGDTRWSIFAREGLAAAAAEAAGAEYSPRLAAAAADSILDMASLSSSSSSFYCVADCSGRIHLFWSGSQ